MAEEIVKTIKGESVPRSQTRYIKGDYHKIGDPKIKGSGDCYKVNNRYCRDNIGYIEYDHTIGEYVIKNDTLIEGVVAVNDEELELGYFSPFPYGTAKIIDSKGNLHKLLDDSILNKNRYYRYNKEEDAYFHISSCKAIRFNRFPILDRSYKYSLTYDSRPVIDKYVGAFNAVEKEVLPSIKKYSGMLKGLTYGLEFETVEGKVPDRIIKPLGLIPLRDGSVNGLEYATIPLEGEQGLQSVLEICKELDKFTRFDDSCSLHLHLGNVPRTEEFFLALFKILCLIQDQVFELFPLYKKYNFGVKKKNYTKPLPSVQMLSEMDKVITSDNIKSNFDVLYKFLSAGQSYKEVGNDLNNITYHPSDPRGNSKWNITSRYYWINMIPLLFGNKSTVEFRIHTPTTDYKKVLNYLFICGAIVNYVKEYQDDILKNKNINNIMLSDIISSQYKNDALSVHLDDYIFTRKDKTYRQNVEGNVKGDERAIKVPYTRGFDWEKQPNESPKPRRTGGIYNQIIQDVILDDFR